MKLREQKKADQRAQNEKIKGSRTSSKFNKVREDVISKGRNQCDNDDYGFESGSADSFYDKLMKKYEANPGKRLIHIVYKTILLLSSWFIKLFLSFFAEDPMAKFARPKSLSKPSSSSSTPDPKFQPFRRQETPSSSSSSKSSSSSSSASLSDSKKSSGSSSSASKKVNKAPPPPSFAELMKMAKNQNGKPVPGGSIGKIPKKEKEAEFDRPMTQKQKEEFMRERNSQLRKQGKLPPEPAKKNGSSSKSSEKSENSSSSKLPQSESKSSPSNAPCKENGFRQPSMKPLKPHVEKPQFERVGATPEFHPAVVNSKSKYSEASSSSSASSSSGSRKRPRSRSRSPSPMARTSSKISKSSRHVNRIESDEEDYDSEMDDFIDDSEANPAQISSIIGNLFGYNRHKYRDDDFDDREMENNKFSSIMKEEARSARIGRQEDLEDMRREEEENRRKMARKKHRR